MATVIELRYRSTVQKDGFVISLEVRMESKYDAWFPSIGLEARLEAMMSCIILALYRKIECISAHHSV